MKALQCRKRDFFDLTVTLPIDQVRVGMAYANWKFWLRLCKVNTRLILKWICLRFDKARGRFHIAYLKFQVGCGRCQLTDVQTNTSERRSQVVPRNRSLVQPSFDKV